MNISGFDHVTVVVTDPERAVAFYRDILGLQEVPSPVTFPAAGLKVRWFQAGNQCLHLYVSDNPDTASPRHFALHVDDARAAREELAAKGLHIRETVEIPGADRFFITDPDGNRIEMIQWHQRT